MNRFRNFAPQAADDLDEAVGRLLDSAVAPAAAERLLKAVLDPVQCPDPAWTFRVPLGPHPSLPPLLAPS